MLLLIAKIIVSVLAILVFAKSYLSYKKRQETGVMFIFWVIVWIVILAFTYKPSLIELLIAPDQGVGIGTVLGIIIAFLTFIMYRVYLKAERIERRLTGLVSELAVQDLDSKNS